MIKVWQSFIFISWVGLYFSTPTFAQLSSTAPWNVVEQKAEVTLLEQLITGEKVKNFRGITRIHAPLSQVIGILNDPANYHRWIPRTRKSFAHEKQKEGFVFYLRIKGPFLIWDRETYLFTQVHCTKDPSYSSQKQIVISFTTDHPQVQSIPLVEEKVIRLPKMQGYWKIWPTENPQETYVEYQAFIDGGGNLTNYLKNKAVKLWIPRMLTNLQKRMKQVGPPDLTRLQQETPQLFPDCLSS